MKREEIGEGRGIAITMRVIGHRDHFEPAVRLAFLNLPEHAPGADGIEVEIPAEVAVTVGAGIVEAASEAKAFAEFLGYMHREALVPMATLRSMWAEFTGHEPAPASEAGQ